jgi:hypothetical protein
MNETSDPSRALAISIRYPQEYEEEPDEEEVQEAVEAAYAIRTWVRSRLGLG